MKSLYILISLLFYSANLNAQIWDYPPKPVSNWSENSNVVKDSLERLIIWNHIIIDGKDSEEKELKLTQEFDSLGNTTKLIYGNSNPILFDNYVNGFWGVKIDGDNVINQTVEFDSNMNVVLLSFNDFVHKVEYDSLSRPLIAENGTEKFIWNYANDLLSSFEKHLNGILSESRVYVHDTLENTVAYTSQFYDKDGNKYPNPESVKAYFNKANEIYKIVSLSHDSNGPDTLIITFDFENHITEFSGTTSCRKIQSFKNEEGYTDYVIVFNCDGTIFSKSSYEYVFEN